MPALKGCFNLEEEKLMPVKVEVLVKVGNLVVKVRVLVKEGVGVRVNVIVKDKSKINDHVEKKDTGDKGDDLGDMGDMGDKKDKGAKGDKGDTGDFVTNFPGDRT